jgi:hypothetical protein
MSRHTNYEHEGQPRELVDQIRLNRIPSLYPKEFDSICKLRSLRERPDILDHLKLELDEIVTQYRRRYSDAHYFTRIEECIRFTNAAAADLENVVDRLFKLDGGHIEMLWRAAREIDSDGFSKADFRELVNQLVSMSQTMKLLTVTITVATGVADNKRGRGRPRNPYSQVAWELIDLWEYAAAKLGQHNKEISIIKRFPRPKKLVERGVPDTSASQESTEFCRLVFRMIDPNIKLSEVRTAINNALNERDTFRQFLQNRSFSRSNENLVVRYTNFLLAMEGAKAKDRKVRK